MNNCNNNNVVFSFLDETIITSITGKKNPKGIWDMRLNILALNKIISIRPKFVFVISNQEGIEDGSVDKRNFEFKMEYIIRSMREYFAGFGYYPKLVEYMYCPFKSECVYKLPDTGMLNKSLTKWQVPFSNKECCVFANNENSVAKMTAKNFGCSFIGID